MTEVGPNITWTRKLECYFSGTGERANCLSWSHTEAEKIFSYRRTFIDLPVIVLSSVTGFLSVGSSTLFSGAPQSSSSALGAVSLFVAVLNTLGTYFSWAKRAEAHRIASIHYSKLYRFICVEMALPREERTQPSEFLKYTKEQYDRLYEISPPLPDEVIKAFHAKFSPESLKDISLPEQMHGLEAIHVYNEGDLENDLNQVVKTKKLEVRHQHNIEKMPLDSPMNSPANSIVPRQLSRRGSNISVRSVQSATSLASVVSTHTITPAWPPAPLKQIPELIAASEITEVITETLEPVPSVPIVPTVIVPIEPIVPEQIQMEVSSEMPPLENLS